MCGDRAGDARAPRTNIRSARSPSGRGFLGRELPGATQDRRSLCPPSETRHEAWFARFCSGTLCRSVSRPGDRSLHLKLALALMGALAVIAVSGASAADFDGRQRRVSRNAGRERVCCAGAPRRTSGKVRNRDGVGRRLRLHLAREPLRLVRDQEQLPPAGTHDVASRRDLGRPHEHRIHALLGLESRLDQGARGA